MTIDKVDFESHSPIENERSPEKPSRVGRDLLLCFVGLISVIITGTAGGVAGGMLRRATHPMGPYNNGGMGDIEWYIWCFFGALIGGVCGIVGFVLAFRLAREIWLR